jgi:DNA-binding XRE family transcriptional regulator
MTDFACYLRDWRREHRLSQAEAAALLNVSTLAIELWENEDHAASEIIQTQMIRRMSRFQRPKT